MKIKLAVNESWQERYTQTYAALQADVLLAGLIRRYDLFQNGRFVSLPYPETVGYPKDRPDLFELLFDPRWEWISGT